MFCEIFVSLLVDINEIKEKFNLPISSGDGKSIDNPILIEKKGSNNFIKLEYFIISHLLNINDDFDYVRNNQRLLNYKNKTIDYIKMKITNKRKSTERFKEFYFDITKVY